MLGRKSASYCTHNAATAAICFRRKFRTKRKSSTCWSNYSCSNLLACTKLQLLFFQYASLSWKWNRRIVFEVYWILSKNSQIRKCKQERFEPLSGKDTNSLIYNCPQWNKHVRRLCKRCSSDKPMNSEVERLEEAIDQTMASLEHWASSFWEVDKLKKQYKIAVPAYIQQI